VADPAPDLATDQPPSEVHGTVKDKLIERASHNHPLYKLDNGTVYDTIEEGLRNTKFAASIVQFCGRRD